MSFHISIKKVLCCLSFVIYGSVPSSALSITYPVYIDVSSGIPTVSSPSPFFWTAGPFDGLHSSVTQLAPGAWAIDIGLVGAWRSWGTQFGLELTDPQTGAVIDSFGIYGGWYNNLYSWTTLKTELFTTDNSGQLAGRYRHSDIAITQPFEQGTNILAASGVTTEWHTWDIYLVGMPGPNVQDLVEQVPEPSPLLLTCIGITGLLAACRTWPAE